MHVYIAIHTHEFGQDTGIFTSERTHDKIDDDEIATALGWDYEPDEGEEIETLPVDIENLPIV